MDILFGRLKNIKSVLDKSNSDELDQIIIFARNKFFINYDIEKVTQLVEIRKTDIEYLYILDKYSNQIIKESPENFLENY